MKSALLLGVFIAIGIGIMIGTQATIGARVGTLIGPTRVGIFMNVAGGLVALLIAGVLIVRQPDAWPLPGNAFGWLLFAGVLGVFIVAGSAFSIGQAGTAAGISGMILGQMMIGTLIDTVGIGGAEPIPLSPTRIAGLVVMAVSVYLLTPRG